MKFSRMLIVGFLTVFGVGPFALGQSQPRELDVWLGKAPGETDQIEQERNDASANSRTKKRIVNVSRPTLTVFRPSVGDKTGTAVIVCPGGGYKALMMDYEGEDVARWLNQVGITGIVLKYRVPRRPDNPGAALQDAQRAISLVRAKAKEWGLDPEHIGMLGFSAGGHLAALAGTNFDRRAYEATDAIDQVSCRPSFCALIYPGGIINRARDALIPELTVTEKSPPMFLAHAADDNPDSSILMFQALRKAGVPAEMHIYASGGHGFGINPSPSPREHPCVTWPARLEDWLRDQKLVSVTGRN